MDEIENKTVQEIRRAISSAADVIRNSIPSNKQGLAYDDEIVKGWNRTEILRAYRDLHVLFGRGPSFVEWMLHAEKMLVLGLTLLGVRLRFTDALTVAAGGISTPVDYRCETVIEGRALLEDCYRCAPDCVLIDAEHTCLRVGIKDGLEYPVIVESDTGSAVPAPTYLVEKMLPGGVIALLDADTGDGTGQYVEVEGRLSSGIIASLPLYDLMLVKSGLLRPYALGRWDLKDGWIGSIPETRVDFLKASIEGGLSVGAGEKSRLGEPALLSVPFEPLPLVGPPPPALVAAMLNRAGAGAGAGAGVTAGAKRLGDRWDPKGKIPYPVDGDFPLDQIVTGIVLQPETPDLSKDIVRLDGEAEARTGVEAGALVQTAGDIYSPEHIKYTMYWWMANTRGRITYIHTTDGGKEVTEECPTLACWQVGERGEKWGEVEVIPGTWLLTVWAKATWVWEAIRTKKIRAFSIGYVGLYRPEPVTA